MSQLAVMPVWVADFFSKTDHLSNEEQWAYLKLMMKTWARNCRALPDSDTDIARLLNMGVKRWRRIRPRIAPFFDLSGSHWVQPRLENVFHEASERRAKIVSGARRGGMVKANKIKDIGSAPGTAGALPMADLAGERLDDMVKLNDIKDIGSAPGTAWPNLENAERNAKIDSAERLSDMVKLNEINRLVVPLDIKRKIKEVREEDTPSGVSPPVTPPPKTDGENVRRGTKRRIPANWEPSAEDCDYARIRGLDPERVFVDFHDYWSDPDTRNALHSDWSRVWQRRCRDLETRQGGYGFARPNGHHARDNSVSTAVRELLLEAKHGRIPH